ncbi:MAG: integrase core domain-containing protein [Burkholderia sp.]
MLVRSPSVLPEIEDMGITSPSRSFMQQRRSQYTSDDFRAQIKFREMTSSYAFVAEPQTNGVAERFNRTMKEQAIHGRLFKNAEEVRAAAVAFKNRYNREWRLEKLGFKSPLEARQAALLPLAA